MHFSASLATALFASTGVLAAIPRSDPFYLVAISDNDKVNGTAFVACHEGAAIESLCVGDKIEDSKKAYSTYRLDLQTKSDPNYGILSWILPGNTPKYHEPMSLYLDPSTNVGLPLFQGADSSTYVGFDKEDMLYMNRQVNDKVSPPKYAPQKLYRWYTCQTLYSSYTYTTLAWSYGPAPQNPSCEKVDVKRVFA